MRTTSVIVAAAIGLALACDGGPKEGDYCENGWPQCQDAHTALWCDYGGAFRPFSCPGPDGCRTTAVNGQTVNSCDVTGTKAGDRCITLYSGFIMCQTDSSALKCNGTKWIDVECATGICVDGEAGIGKVESRGSCK
ncbi:MAG TPA: hypothetical protein VGK67_20005 [Myxococcales bacterium]|jgi:hypothetical protein